MTLIQKAVKWLNAHPGATFDEAVKAGLTHHGYYRGKAIIKLGLPATTFIKDIPSTRSRGKQARVSSTVTTRPVLENGLAKLGELVKRLSDELNVEELHYSRSTGKLKLTRTTEMDIK